MELGSIGPLTTAFEAAATVVGAGVVLGSVTMGVVGLALGWPRRSIERRALADGYLGGALGLGIAVFDLVFRYALK